jgi:hypothetical protein
MWPFGKRRPVSNPAEELQALPKTEQPDIALVEEAVDEQHLQPISRADLRDMQAHRHDVEYQCELVLRMMQEDECVPYPFDRAVTLLRKQHRYEEEAIICRYVKDWAAEREAEYTTGAKAWLDPGIQRIIRRLAEAEALWLESPHRDH